MKNRETEPSGRWAQHRFWYLGGKTGESIVPLGLQNSTIKKGEALQRGGKDWTRESFEKVLSKRKLREISKITSRYPRNTIAHTRIQKESNFANFRGLNNHLRL